MIGKRQSLTRILLLILILSFSCRVGHSQVDFESKAVEYFCSNRLIIDPTLKGMDIIYSWTVEAKPSKVYDIADCMGDINLLKDSIPNKHHLDSLEQVYSTKQYTEKKINIGMSCSFLKKKRPLFKKDVFYMSVYNPILYEGKNLVEIFLHNKKRRTYRVVVFSLNDQGKILDYCLKYIIYD